MSNKKADLFDATFGKLGSPIDFLFGFFDNLIGGKGKIKSKKNVQYKNKLSGGNFFDYIDGSRHKGINDTNSRKRRVINDANESVRYTGTSRYKIKTGRKEKREIKDFKF